MRIEHVALNLPDPVKAAKWYAENLAMQVLKSSAEPPYAHFLCDMEGHSMLEFYNNPKAAVPDYASQDPLTFHIAFMVYDMKIVRDKLLQAGAQAVGEVTQTDDGNQLAMLRDPWGVAIQLVKRKTPFL